MIIFRTLKFSNIFSYGKNNEIILNENQITQILGNNGHGKSSIPLILEEVLYNKNSKGIKRGDILNRFVSDKKYSISLEFEKISEVGVENYLIETSRGTTQSVSLSQLTDGKYVDISCHTSTATYKEIEKILGFSHDIFVSLIYQSSAQSMEFLTATDTTRKKFLIELLGLDKYTEIFEKFKILAKEVGDSVLEAESKVVTFQKWIDKNSKIDRNKITLKHVPQEPKDLIIELSTLKVELRDIDKFNESITLNNQYRKCLSSVELDVDAKKPEDNTEYLKEKTELDLIKRTAELDIKKAKELKDTCPTCKQSVDISFVPSLISEKEKIVKEAEDRLNYLQEVLNRIAKDTKRFQNAEKANNEFEKYSILYNKSLPETLRDRAEYAKRINDLELKIKFIENDVREIQEFNKQAITKNTQIDVIIEQSESMLSELSSLSKELTEQKDRLAIIEILKKAFSTNGLLAYKIECLVKDLEVLVNKYLTELSDGRFQLSFTISNDKLNVIIHDIGHDVDISALSNGEKSRVNTATLLAIRVLMQALSSTKVNLLILDETIDSLDTYGKERLVEILLNEQGLNTFLISHGYSHPLLEKINVIKEDNISRIE